MPINRNTLLRYKTIDRMLRKGRRATLQELIDACSDALYEAYGYGDVSRRTIQHDIFEMRNSSELGYYAPISVVDRKYYRYDDYDYSITDVPLSETDMRQLTEAVELLKQMSSFKGFDDVEDVVNRLEDHVASMRFRVEPVILLEGNARYRRDPPDCRIASQIETMRSLGMDSWDGRRPADFPLRRGVPAETESN